MAWANIFSSSNFWTAASGFGGTILGGYITWKIQRASENKKQHEINLLAFRYHALMIEKIHHAASTIKPAFDLQNTDPTKYLKTPKQFALFPKYQDRDTAIDLSFLSSERHSPLLEALENYRRHFEMLTLSFNLRNEHFQELLDITSPLYQKGRKLTMEEVKHHIGPKLNGDLKSVTDILVRHTNCLMNEYPPLRTLIMNTAREKFPGENFLKLDVSNHA